MPLFDDLPRPIAFALSGGASLGAMQVGMLQAAAAVGIRPDRLYGTSVGALNAAYCARGWDAAALDRLADVWLGITGRDVFGDVSLTAVALAIGADGALANPDRLRALVSRHLPVAHADLALPFTAVASDLRTGEIVELSAGDLRQNVLASAAIPIVFPPVTIDGRLLVDGAIAAAVPLVPAARGGAQTIVAFDVTWPCLPPEPPRGAIPRLMHVLRLMLQHQALAVLPLLEQRVTVLYLPSPCPLHVNAHDFGHSDDLIETGRRLGETFFDGLRIDGPGVYGHPRFGGHSTAASEVQPPLLAALRSVLLEPF